VKEFALDFFLNYAIDDPDLYTNSGKLPDSLLGSSKKSSQFQKNTICLDGNNIVFTDTETLYPVEKSKNLKPTHIHTPDGTFSVVIPVFSPLEELVNMDQSWNEFYESIPDTSANSNMNNIDEFKNLNDQLINSEKYKALVSTCFNLQNIVHFNALSGLKIDGYENEKIKNAFKNTKEIMLNSLKATANGKKTT
jgi:hypothetical protein